VGAGGAGLRVNGKLSHQAYGRKREEPGKHEEHVAPAKKVAQDAAGGLAEQLAQNLAGDETSQDLLQAIVRDDISDIGHRDRNDPAGSRTGGEPRQGKLRQGRYGSADGDQYRADGAGQRHGSIFAETVGQRADHELNGAVGHGISGHHHRGQADSGMQIGRNLRQERVHHSDLRLAGKARDRKQRDCAHRRFGRPFGGRLGGRRVQHGRVDLGHFGAAQPKA
jgi:hypothetical protein